jgi:hypothetical protein
MRKHYATRYIDSDLLSSKSRGWAWQEHALGLIQRVFQLDKRE